MVCAGAVSWSPDYLAGKWLTNPGILANQWQLQLCGEKRGSWDAGDGGAGEGVEFVGDACLWCLALWGPVPLARVCVCMKCSLKMSVCLHESGFYESQMSESQDCMHYTDGCSIWFCPNHHNGKCSVWCSLTFLYTLFFSLLHLESHIFEK